jgi:tetratricopeptide (TPR) repeat protein
VWLPPLMAALGYACALSGRTSEGVTLLTNAIEQMTATGHRFYRTLAELWIAEALLLDGRTIGAMSRASAALDLAERYGEKGNKAYALRLLGEFAMGTGASEEAASHLRAARALASAGGSRPLEAQCQLSLAQLLAQLGNAVEAQLLMISALDTFRELRLVRDATRAELAARDLLSTRPS